MRTTAQPVVKALREHILENFEEEVSYHREHYGKDATPLDLLRDQIQAMQYGDRTLYQAALDYVEGGSLLVYYYDVQQFLNGLGINPTGKEYSDEKAWRLYCHLVAREIAKMVAS